MTTALDNTTRLDEYGAVELKKLAGRHAFYGLFLSVGIVGAVFLLVFIISSMLDLRGDRVIARDINRPIILYPLSTETQVTDKNRVHSEPKGTGGEGISTAIVEPVGPSIASIANETPISTPVFTEEELGGGSSNTFGDPSAPMGNGILGGSPLGSVGTDTTTISSEGGSDWEEIPDILPQVDMQQLQHNIVYPELALRRELEGKVVISVLIDGKGKVVESSILQSTHSVFNDAALKAVRKSSFTPAFRNGKPVSFPLIIPVTFLMRR